MHMSEICELHCMYAQLVQTISVSEDVLQLNRVSSEDVHIYSTLLDQIRWFVGETQLAPHPLSSDSSVPGCSYGCVCCFGFVIVRVRVGMLNIV
jgi:hypothetical protein